jgi:tetratricopeptide (TPR) repeat protein
MTKNIKRNSILNSRSDVHINRNFIEDTLLNLKHFFQHNREKVLQFGVTIFLGFFLIVILYGIFNWLGQKADIELYEARKVLQNTIKEMSYLALIDESSSHKQGKTANDDFILKSKKETEKKFQDAIQKLQKLANSFLYSFFSAHDLAIYEIGYAYFTKNEYANAIKYLGDFFDKNKKHFLAMGTLEMEAVANEQLKKYDRALKLYQKLYDLDPLSQSAPRGLYSIGRMNEKLGKVSEAEKNYKKLIKSFKNQSFYYTDLAKKRLYLLGI